MTDCFEKVLELRSAGHPCVLVTVTNKTGDGPCSVGAKMVVETNRNITGTVGGGRVEYLAIDKAIEIIETHVSQSIEFELTPNNLDEVISKVNDASTSKVVKTGMVCGGSATFFFEYICTPHPVYIFGAGHIGRALSYHLLHLNYSVHIIDNREEYLQIYDETCNTIQVDYDNLFEKFSIANGGYVIIATPSHAFDYEVLRAIYKNASKPSYIGLVASKKKVNIFIDRLQKDFDVMPDLSTLYTPAGLNIGGNTPHEIAISLIAEMQSLKYDKNIACNMKISTELSRNNPEIPKYLNSKGE